MDKNILITIIGSTGVGKTALSIDLANYFGTEIVSVDSRQFYKELNKGTAKPTRHQLSRSKHHFINSHSIHDHYSSGAYGRDVDDCLKKLFKKYKIIVAVGGSTLYLKALWDGFDPIPKTRMATRKQLLQEYKEYGLIYIQEELKQKDITHYHKVDIQNPQRIMRALEVIRDTGNTVTHYHSSGKPLKKKYFNIKLGLELEREKLFLKINDRMDAMIQNGLFEEAESLYPYRNYNALNTVGYKEIFGYLERNYNRSETIRLLKRNSRRYAKRQLTWFKKIEDIHRISALENTETVIRKLEKLIDTTDSL